MIGGGKYDDLCHEVWDKCEATDGLVMVAVIGGNNGNGFSVKGEISKTLMLPHLLRFMADEIERQHKEGEL